MIYFIQPEFGGPIKIGLAKNPKRRLVVIQVNHYERLVLRCVMDGDRDAERDLHKRFAHCWRIGEWFEPSDDLMEFMATLDQIDWVPSRGRWGVDNSSWKEGDAHLCTKRSRFQRRFPLGPCVSCGGKAHDRRVLDGDYGNLSPENVAFYCRRCLMGLDGRLDKFIAYPKIEPLPPKACSHCGRLAKPLRRGRCGACNEYLRRTGRERPADLIGSKVQGSDST